MNQEQAIEMQITNYFKQSEKPKINPEEMLLTLMESINAKKQQRSEKAIIAGLLEKIETENDHVKLQLYRRALEILLQRNR